MKAHKRRRRYAWTWARRTTALLFLALILLGSRDWFPWFKGTTTSTRLLGRLPLADPLAAIEVTLASRALHTDLLIGAGLLIAACLVLGPVFCGWVCPLGLVLDLNQTLRRTVRHHVLRRRDHAPVPPLPGYIKVVVLGLVLGFALVARMPAFQVLSPINMIAWAVIGTGSVGLLVVGGIALVEWFVPRLWCRALCPLGALYGLIGRRAWLRVRVNPAEAGRRPCHQCTVHCPMGIRVMEDYALAKRAYIDHPDCNRCGSCVDICPRGVLRLGFKPFEPGAPAGAPFGQPCDACDCPAGQPPPQATPETGQHLPVARG